MAFLPQSNFQRNREYLMTGDTVPAPDQSQQQDDAAKMPVAMPVGSGGAQESPTPEMDLRTTSAPATTTQTQEQKPDGTIKTTTTQAQPVFKTTGSLYQRLRDPVTGRAGQAQERLQQASDIFRQMAGPSRTYESVGGEETVRQAIETGRGMQEAKELATAQYGGPRGLDPTQLSQVQSAYEKLAGRTRAMGTGGGLATIIRGSTPGLTRGEALYEARRRLPEVEAMARDLQYGQVNPLRRQIEEQSEAAQEFARQRALEEDLIRASARGQLTGRKDVIEEDLARVIEDARARQEAAQQAYEDILGVESPERLAALEEAAPFLRAGTTAEPGEAMGREVAEAFRTPGYEATQEGQALMEEIMSDPRYAEIADYDPLGLRVTSRGKQAYSIGGELGGKDVREVERDRATRRLLYERQRELEEAFGRGGEYNVTSPLYFGDQYQAPDPIQYLGFDPGTSPTRENLATGEQKAVFNRITDLLGSLDKIGEAQPFRAAQIFAQADQYLEDEEAALEARGEELTKRQKNWKKMVKKARKEYKKAKKTKDFAKIAGAVMPKFLGGEELAQFGGKAAYGQNVLAGDIMGANV